MALSKEEWYKLFRSVDITDQKAKQFADIFVKNAMTKSLINELTHEGLKSVSISLLADRLEILKLQKRDEFIPKSNFQAIGDAPHMATSMSKRHSDSSSTSANDSFSPEQKIETAMVISKSSIKSSLSSSSMSESEKPIVGYHSTVLMKPNSEERKDAIKKTCETSRKMKSKISHFIHKYLLKVLQKIMSSGNVSLDGAVNLIQGELQNQVAAGSIIELYSVMRYVRYHSDLKELMKFDDFIQIVELFKQKREEYKIWKITPDS
ncbi:unnamed protein product [Didymodactylos carnosus]|uniref:Uncharacterized protein n=1 Tax=Didymodactylos carnosus TaxID=1234261 RepID=A0A815FUG7_9BILA|nr:unnamed protein product [Didymodactylos carnosus]CAF1325547.1 unnamed protein product [Didymodactylos carnosus]CAF3917154.1 unnamed protein product [Didymodactylos carnosus]CAF4174984.1 unnamed protein product [Didymodactylos carnosus]